MSEFPKKGTMLKWYYYTRVSRMPAEQLEQLVVGPYNRRNGTNYTAAQFWIGMAKNELVAHVDYDSWDYGMGPPKYTFD